MRNESEFLAEIYARYTRNKRKRKRKYIQTAVSLCLFLIVAAALPSVLSEPRKSPEPTEPTYAGTDETGKRNQLTPTTEITASPSGKAPYENIHFGSADHPVPTPTNSPNGTSGNARENDFAYPFTEEDIASVAVRNGKGKTYYLSSEQGISAFYSYLIKEKAFLHPSLKTETESFCVYTAELQFFIKETKTFYITDQDTAQRLESLMKKLQKNEP